MIDVIQDWYPLSKKKKIRGNRQLVREKVLQILTAHEISGTDMNLLYNLIFNRDFTFDMENTTPGVLLRPNEIEELESDIPIAWKKKDVLFAQELLKSCIDEKSFVAKLIFDAVKEWDIDRITTIDRNLILIAVAEMMHFPTIHTIVSINVVLEIAKEYSTDKSHIFINGVLDTCRKKLIEKNLINKNVDTIRKPKKQ